MPNASRAAPSSAHFDQRARQLPSALREVMAVHERVADMYGRELPRVRIAVGDILLFDSSEPAVEVSRKQRCVELARTLLRPVHRRLARARALISERNRSAGRL